MVVDTNVVISGLRSSRGTSFRLLELIGRRQFEIALSVPLVFEYEDVLKRQSEELGLTAEDVEALLDYWCSVAHLQEIHFLWRPALRDPKDDHLLELAVASGSGRIITHNVRDFVQSASWGVVATTPREFLKGLGVTK
ncbi:MAG: putative toxin-antitoxin system toxin component, PIN family [Coriobacteriia bacterium]|nr:putative toxin-antitoxin system toxin component, PIN family [Coriobacteriia bacterium]